ncbi:uncharacterized protein LOC143353824 [Halictus rubicundus]|uniref:uncharacterized protein LOC143353824 n=1 Tax=Halictus rubicundus TaxID=77578 RepID=UPI004035E09E
MGNETNFDKAAIYVHTNLHDVGKSYRRCHSNHYHLNPSSARVNFIAESACRRPIIGPYFIQGTLTGIKYAAFLRQDLSGLLEEITLFDRERMWFQHAGCLAHYSKVARTVLNTKYPGRWIGRRGPIPWPARSPDLTKDYCSMCFNYVSGNQQCLQIIY